MSGITVHSDERLRFLTLTSTSESGALSRDFRHLIDIIRHTTPLDLWSDGYVKWRDMRRFFPARNILRALTIGYCRVRTSEGYGVLHVPYYGDFLPQSWISDRWNEIHGARVVDIRACKTGAYDKKRLVRYVLSQYLANQDALEQYSTGGAWIFKGYRTYFKSLIKQIGYFAALARWDTILRSGRDPLHIGQWTLDGPPPGVGRK